MPLLINFFGSIQVFVTNRGYCKQQSILRVLLILGSSFFWNSKSFAQDTTIVDSSRRITLPEIWVRNGFNYKLLLQQIKSDTSFYKAFRNLRVLEYNAFNDIKMIDKNGKTIASLFSKTKQIREAKCRSTTVLEEITTGDFYDKQKNYNYTTAELYAGIFFSKGKVCGETNNVTNYNINTDGKSGMDKHKEQLKMLFFNPGKKIPGIPFIGDKLDLYDEDAQKIYDYKMDIVEYEKQMCYSLNITPKEEKNSKVVVDEMTTWFNANTLEVVARNYSLSYKAGVYDFNVSMEVVMQKFNDLTVPKTLRYKGDWNVLFKKRERGSFTATLFNFGEGKN